MRRTTRDRITPRMRRVLNFIERLPREMHEQFVSNTPIRSGNARSKTDLNNGEIQANYPYSIRLEKESWSRQAPRGMSDPTIEWVRQRLRDLN